MDRHVRIAPRPSAVAFPLTEVYANGNLIHRSGSTQQLTNTGRCHRLGKSCTKPAAVRKRGTKRSATSRTSVLEDKLDNLASMLRTQSRADQAATSTATLESLGCSIDHIPVVEPPRHELCERDLHEFRQRHLLFFPLIELTQSVTVAQLQQEKPMLCLAIKALTTKALSRQAILAKDLRTQLAQKISVQGERSMDLLLSVLVCVSW